MAFAGCNARTCTMAKEAWHLITASLLMLSLYGIVLREAISSGTNRKQNAHRPV